MLIIYLLFISTRLISLNVNWIWVQIQEFSNFDVHIFSSRSYTANLFTAKTAGFHCVRFLTVISLQFEQSLIVCSEILQSNLKTWTNYIFCSHNTAISTIKKLHQLQLKCCNFDCFISIYCSPKTVASAIW